MYFILWHNKTDLKYLESLTFCSIKCKTWMHILGRQIRVYDRKHVRNDPFRVRDQLLPRTLMPPCGEERQCQHQKRESTWTLLRFIWESINKQNTHKSFKITSPESILSIQKKITGMCALLFSWKKLQSADKYPYKAAWGEDYFFVQWLVLNTSIIQNSYWESWWLVVVHLSAFSLGLKLVDSCSLKGFLFDLYFLILILL